MAELDLLIRARRVVLPDGIRPAAVGVAGGLIVDVVPYEHAARGRGDGRAGRRRGLAARAGRHPRAHQRAGPDRLGGIRVRDPRRSGRRHHHDHRHAAEQGPADRERRRAARQARRRGWQCHVDVGFWGGAVPGNDDQRAAAACGPGCSGSSASPSTRASPSSRRWTKPRWSGPAAGRRARQPAHRSRRGCRRPRGRAAAAGRDYASFLRSRPRGGRDGRHRPRHRAGARHRGPRHLAAPVRRGRAAR